MPEKELAEKIFEMKKSGIAKKVNGRMKEFAELGKENDSEKLFSELCFCILTANFDAAKTIAIQVKIGSGFASFPEKKLAAKLKELGHRFPNTRARYIVAARKQWKETEKRLDWGKERETRKWLAENVKGLGYKEASHFLRNIGFRDLAIIDFHILDLLARHGLVEEGRKMSVKKYLETEKILERISGKTKTSLAELDLYLWFMETGKMLK